MKQLLTLFTLCFFIYEVRAQCTVPNGDFEKFDQTIKSTVFLGDITIDLPADGWTESLYFNVASRLTSGKGFFNKYVGDDADTSALLLIRGPEGGAATFMNLGFITIECNDLPQAITGSYKFSGSNEPTVEDSLMIGAFAYKAIDYPIDTFNPHLPHITNENFTWTLCDTSHNFKNFEIDLSDFEGEDIDRITIQIVMAADTADFLNTQDEATSVIDNISFVYDNLSSYEEEWKKEAIIYPNPTTDVVRIQTEEKVTTIEVYNTVGSLMKIAKNNDEVNISHLDKGIYILHIHTQNDGVIHQKIVKE